MATSPASPVREEFLEDDFNYPLADDYDAGTYDVSLPRALFC